MKICFASILGRPNVGKSSLLNSIIGYNVAIVTDTAQTTRDQITGIYTDDTHQIIFTDTPGIHKPENQLGETLNKNAYDSIKDIDVLLFLTPIDEKIGPGDKMILDKISKIENKIAVISKIDKAKGKPELVSQKINELTSYNFKHIISTDIKNLNSIENLINLIKEFSYEGQLQYDPEYLTDKSMRFIAKEIIRESAINLLYDELPHSIAIEITEFNEADPERIFIDAIIYVKKDSQKGMVIGKKAEKIKKIGTNARLKIMQQFGTPINLSLKVKVAKKWNDNVELLSKFGYK
ncbi:GTPase Era [Mycoplasmopsis felis]|uniref:GTPase Era n=1 Tax=Mycoplasmopsis felis TaxID=33923 RepID=UPI002AFE6236|nr:GTPase Era [Mycoplasmopsis felis]WQQ03492.1 GTPase Era [Mycoplasmopsis felis]WQQ05760.1 GTPase Era [Mycoplasmopsis felis]WQQ06145.1 GTPase Era [Mycoplasmopsis felis]WQQ07419.1 GTPase Era [Mycoplasmopsis felis]WQQ11370.1 GTPase Era [Mycoplasmopsis felis]